ncbi:MAG TPA: Rieske (2Fe-2S) protein [Thermomicrobiaceae bacterium]|nr:Rieske (2Fe-2S) protein [Thermomicrobiaceae bacterium]
MAQRYVVGRVRDFPPGERRIVEVDGVAIGVFNVHGAYYALRSRCPHQGAPLCLGRVTGRNTASRPFELDYAREGEIIKCPWHGWEFEIATGRSVFNPHKVRVRTYEVTVEAEDEDPSIPTYPVTVEDGLVILHA